MSSSIQPSTHPPLEVRSVVKRFRQGSTVVQALGGVDLVVRAAEFVCIMGASGSGKSTLLHVMAGLTDVDEGSVLVDGEDLGTMSDSKLTAFRRQRIGLVFQSFNLIPALSAEDNICLPAVGIPDAPARCQALMERLGVGARRKHKPSAMSGGEQQRVAIARALITNPVILLADEPTGSLDSIAGQQICKLLRSLCDDEKRTIVVVTHEPAVVAWADRVVVLRDGRQVSDFDTAGLDGPQALARAYQNALDPVSGTGPARLVAVP